MTLTRRAAPAASLTMALVVALAACTSTPYPSPSMTPSSPSIVVASPQVTTRPTPTASGGPASSPSLELSSSSDVDLAGSFGPDGLWAIKGTTLFISTDRGVGWRASSIPAATNRLQGSTFVLDQLHTWSINRGPGSTGDSGSASDVTNYVVSRTVDGGATWQTSIAGNYPDTSASIGFIDALHGYVLAAAQRFSFGTSTVLRTDDGGATWSVGGTGPWLGSLLAVSDESTVWAGGEEQAGGMFEQPLLAVSRDTGRRWSSLALPGITGTTEAECGCFLAERPLFLDPMTGFVTVGSLVDEGTWLERTIDGGRTWSLVSRQPSVQSTGVAILDSTNWLLATVNPTGVSATADAGASWTLVSSGGAWDQTFGLWIHGWTTRQAVALLSAPDTHDASQSVLIATDDGGRTWNQLEVGP